DFSDTVPAGNVIGGEVTDGTVVRPGDSISLTISRGKEQVAVPDIVGMTWDKAKKALSAANFTFTYNNKVAADTLPTLFSVATTNPAFGQMADKGSSVKVTLLFSG
ncbi:MAG: PASTA domain-containing protein, partial [Microbacteriaceae bacterium]|nr:PASTA domain-containing protein [Microbacteriaceae bacterium]